MNGEGKWSILAVDYHWWMMKVFGILCSHNLQLMRKITYTWKLLGFLNIAL